MLSRAPLALIALLLLAATGCNSDSAGKADATPAPRCPATWKGDWQKLADKAKAMVYCPGWMPQPLTGEIGPEVSFGGAGGSSESYSKKGGYMATFIYAEGPQQEVHVNFRGYPGMTRIPICETTDINGGKVVTNHLPCFADPGGTYTNGDINATLYTVNQGEDRWHLLYAWRTNGSLYTVSEHVIPPYSYNHVLANLHRMIANLVPLQPSA
jgi:hypothetical protein